MVISYHEKKNFNIFPPIIFTAVGAFFVLINSRTIEGFYMCLFLSAPMIVTPYIILLFAFIIKKITNKIKKYFKKEILEDEKDV